MSDTAPAHPDRSAARRRRAARQQAARPVHAVPAAVPRRRGALDRPRARRRLGHRAGRRRGDAGARAVHRRGADLVHGQPRPQLHRLPAAGHRRHDPARGHRRRAHRPAVRGHPRLARLGAEVAAAVRRRHRRRERVGDGRRGVPHRAAAGGDGLQGGRAAPDGRAWSAGSPPSAPATRPLPWSPASTRSSPASPRPWPAGCPPTSPAPRSPRSRTTSSTWPRRSCWPRWPGSSSTRVVEPRLVREGAPTEHGRDPRRRGRRRPPQHRGRGGRPPRCATPRTDLSADLEPTPSGAGVRRAGLVVPRARRADLGRRAARRVAVAQRGRRLPAGVAAAGLDRVHRLRAVPRPRPGLRLHDRQPARVRRRARR